MQQHSADACKTLVPVILDVTEQATIDATHAVVSTWVAEHGQPLIAVVNNAGISKEAPHELMAMKDYRNGWCSLGGDMTNNMY